MFTEADKSLRNIRIFLTEALSLFVKAQKAKPKSIMTCAYIRAPSLRAEEPVLDFVAHERDIGLGRR